MVMSGFLTLSELVSGTAVAVPLPKDQCSLPQTSGEVSKFDKKSLRDLLAGAKVAYDKGDFLKATGAIRAAYLMSPTVEIAYNLAQACREAGNWQDALALYEGLRGRNPDPTTREEAERQIEALRKRVSESHDERARGFMDASQYGKASQAWSEAFETYPDSVYLYRRGRAQRAAADLPGAVQSFGEFLRRAAEDPLAAEVRQLISRLNVTQEQMKSAQADYDKGAYTAAFVGFQAAYRFEPLPILVYLSARARQKDPLRTRGSAADGESAILLYEKFLRECPPTQHLAERQAAEQEVARDRAALNAARHVPVYKKWWFWTALLGGIGAATAVGVGIGISHRNANQNPLPDVPDPFVIPIP